jgi:hypothetical protein
MAAGGRRSAHVLWHCNLLRFLGGGTRGADRVSEDGPEPRERMSDFSLNAREDPNPKNIADEYRLFHMLSKEIDNIIYIFH